MMMIHPTAIVSSKAELADDVEVGPYAIIGENVIIGPGVAIGAHSVIERFVTIGANCRIFQYASIGAPPQDLKFKGEESFVKIGARTVIREFVTINRGTAVGGGITQVGDDCFLMAYTHVAHDCIVGNRVVLANNATLAGHITIGDYATVGGLVAIHQFVKIGDHAFIGGMSGVGKDIPPYVIAAGARVTLHGLNIIGLKRFGMTDETLSLLKKAYRIVFRIGLTVNQAIERVRAEVEQVPEVVKFIEFIKASERGLTR